MRTSFTLAQSSTIIGDWAAKNGIKKVATLTSDYAPGNDALNFFKQNFTAGGGEIVEEVKVPLANPDFAPFLQRMKDAKPDAMFVFVPAGQAGTFAKQVLLSEMTRELWQMVMEQDVNGFFNVTQPLVMPMVRTRWGRIITITSPAGLAVTPGAGSLAAGPPVLRGRKPFRLRGEDADRAGVRARDLAGRRLHGLAAKRLPDRAPAHA